MVINGNIYISSDKNTPENDVAVTRPIQLNHPYQTSLKRLQRLPNQRGNNKNISTN